MSEINCLVILNNAEKEFLLNMDTKLSFASFKEQIRKNLQLQDDDSLHFSYLDNEDDKISFDSEPEYKEFLDHAPTVEIITLFVTNTNKQAEKKEESIVPKVEEKKEEQKREEEVIKENDVPPKPTQIPLIRHHRRYYFPMQQYPIPKVLEEKREVNEEAKKEVREEVKEEKPQRTHTVICDHCNTEISNIRYKCLQCQDYDLCEKCEELNGNGKNFEVFHPTSHIFAKIREPIHRPQLRPLRNFPPHYFNRFSALRCRNPEVCSTVLNNNNSEELNNNNNIINEEVKSEKPKFDKCSLFHQRGEMIKNLENRVQSLEEEVTQIRSSLSRSSSDPSLNDRKYWAFQC